MSRSVAELATQQMNEIAAVERDQPPLPPPPEEPLAVPTLAPPERIRRYTAELPDPLYRQLRHFVVDEATTAYRVHRALISLLVSDEEIARRVRELIRG